MTAAAMMSPVALPRPGELPADGRLFAGRVLLDERSSVLAGRIDAAFLAEAGWDAAAWVLTLPAEHPLLGRTFCCAPGCQTTCAAATRVCLDCQRQARRGRAGPGGRRAAAAAARQALARRRRRDMPGYRVPAPVGDVRSAAVP